ncbi:methionyl-tRNA formyltransferase [Swaminathania salitolerans]|uniref:Methionyl-tRNA formyltransferase n=1 Tax=Swaminathania salitolerans TaxID=182838 RepID=A0A511BM85_9PROT|nr:methionyl-tRNA formyltransferase [Swaminathania salitolerans]GBQ15684.1 methionyl-tRNA formyl transferase [Swaminathania salitolerans LMG 21291]GEL01447.1 methionyl-tRNA formyltransferase [Swaminathania salitolerans]
MRLVFMGTPDFAVPVLEALRAQQHEIVQVYTQPPRPAGRGKALRPSPVHRAAEAAGIPVRCPTRLRHDVAEHAFFRALDADLAIVVAYGLILPQTMLDAPRLGCLNVHASLLPRWRGASPIQSAILAGDGRSGVSIMQMDAGLDTGDVLAEAAIDLSPRETASGLHDRLSLLGAELLLETLQRPFAPTPQPEHGVTYAERLTRESGRIDWRDTAAAIDRQIRGLTPWPGAFTTLDGVVLKIGAAEPVAIDHALADDAAMTPGTTLDSKLTILCGRNTEGESNALRITRLQRPGKAMMPAEAFLRGTPLAKGTRLGE